MREDVKKELVKKFAEMHNEELTQTLSFYIQCKNQGRTDIQETLKLLYDERHKRLFGRS